MTEPDSLLNAQQRKKAARKARQQRERDAHRNLDALTGDAIAQALALAPKVADASSMAESDMVIDVALMSASEAKFVRKRVNDALNVGEWLTEVRVWVWDAQQHFRPALSERGRESGIELRMEQAPTAS